MKMLGALLALLIFALCSIAPAQAGEKKLSRTPAATAATWGGNGIELTVDGESAWLNFYCGSGAVESGWKNVNGKVDARGTRKSYQGTGPGPDISAHYRAVITGSKMKLVIETDDSKETYRLTLGSPPQIDPCTRP